MRDGVRVAIEANGERRTVHVHDDEDEIDVGGATFRFAVGGNRDRSDDGAEVNEDDVAEGTATADDGATDEDDAGDETGDPRYIGPIEEVPTDRTIRCEALAGRRGVEFILRRDGETAFAWRNSCPHKPKVRLDPGWGAMVRDGQIVCHEHGARFECGDGLCTYGPCRGDALDPILVDVRDGDVYLTDDRFEACRRLS